MRQLDRIKQDMYDATPQYYHEVVEAQEILDRQAELLSEVHIDANDVLDQFFIETATWGLSYWERLVGIAGSDKSTFEEMEEDLVTFNEMEFDNWSVLEVKYPDDLEDRRSRVKSIIRGHGTITLEHIKGVVSSYANGEVEVVNDAATYSIIIRFIDDYGVPSEIDKLQSTLREIVPAHLAITYEFRYVTYEQATSTYTTYDALSTTGKTYDNLLNGQ